MNIDYLYAKFFYIVKNIWRIIVFYKMTNTSTNHVLMLSHEIKNELKADFKNIKINNDYINENEIQEILFRYIEWLSCTPKNVVFRINTILCEQQVAYDHIKETLQQYSRPIPSISTFSCVPELIIVDSWDGLIQLNLEKQPHEVIVDAICGAAILRGSHVYAPGVLGIPRGLNVGDMVSVYVDQKRACKKGLNKKFEDENKLFIGNGIIQMTREQLFGHAMTSSGVAVSMTDVTSYIPQLNSNILPKGYVVLQNLSSIICSRVLNPQPKETILDMCAAPGNKTTHIAALMKNEGTVIAIDKIKSKVERLTLNIKICSLKNVRTFCFDSVKAVGATEKKSLLDGPPFLAESFDRILLDAPCSALGQRPQINNPITVSQLRSYKPLQRKLFTAAVQLLKPGGTLVYSTCTITIAENEGIIVWALKTFPNLTLQPVNEMLINFGMEKFATLGYNIEGLSTKQSNCLCRFGYENDSVGFFIACLIKK